MAARIQDAGPVDTDPEKGAKISMPPPPGEEHPDVDRILEEFGGAQAALMNKFFIDLTLDCD